MLRRPRRLAAAVASAVRRCSLALIIVTLVVTFGRVDGLAAVARGAGGNGRARTHAVELDPAGARSTGRA